MKFRTMVQYSIQNENTIRTALKPKHTSSQLLSNTEHGGV